MLRRMSIRIEDRKQDQADGAQDRKDNRQNGQRLVEPSLVVKQESTVPQPPLRDEREVEEDARDDGARDEERFQTLRADVGYVAVQSQKAGELGHFFVFFSFRLT